MRKLCAAALLLVWGIASGARAQEVRTVEQVWGNQPKSVPLWDKGAPGFESRKDEAEKVATRDEPENNISFPILYNIHNPSITPFLPEASKNTGCAVVIAPGGGHMFLTMDREGYDLAKYLADRGIAAFVLKYRLARDREGNSPYEVGVHGRDDGQRAIRLIRSRAAEWKVNPDHVGIIGFSAGGEIVNMTTFNPAPADSAAEDPVKHFSGVPNFSGMVYSGRNGVPQTIPEGTPPAFMLAAFNDRGPTNNLLNMALAYRAAGIPVEIHIFSVGGHGFGVRQDRDMGVTSWADRFIAWLNDQKQLTKPAGG